ncbi:MAG TPA: hypothetical protein VGN74_11405 [Brevundimonas sp.]|jgi:hypothetical protein|uniref:hypothetical protein n=1 Tax=Brevundimonas sp. TaxID=1871086 RepID=UPI002E15E8D8|nr:hypothetical protein [Brevundimonas sp.]
MFRHTIRATPASDVAAVVGELERKASRAGLDAVALGSVVESTRTVLRSLVEQGATLAANGSALNVTRDLTGPGYSVKVMFGNRPKRSFLDMLLGR